MSGFARDKEGKISATTLSPYGEAQLRAIQGAKLHFSDQTLAVKGHRLVDEKGKTVEKIDNDRMVNKIMFKLM